MVPDQHAGTFALDVDDLAVVLALTVGNADGKLQSHIGNHGFDESDCGLVILHRIGGKHARRGCADSQKSLLRFFQYDVLHLFGIYLAELFQCLLFRFLYTLSEGFCLFFHNHISLDP